MMEPSRPTDDVASAATIGAGRRVMVTVTYGKRWDFLRRVIDSVREQGIDGVFVLDNGSTEDIQSLATERFGDYVTVISLPRNRGSAGGYSAAIKAAVASGADYLLLLDDDNVLEPGCLEWIERTYREFAKTTSRDKLAMLAYRPDRHADVAIGMPAHGMDANPAAFFGFDLADLPFKVFRRTRWGKRWIARRPVRASIVVATAPYSGLYFHRSVPEGIGYPDERFLLYADDTEYSYRLTRARGTIVLVTDARLRDLELSWNIRSKYSNTLDALLLADGDFRAYYSTRNNAYFERRDCHAGAMRSLNRAVYIGGLRVRAFLKKRHARMRLLMNAIHDGEAGRLGENQEFPLQ